MTFENWERAVASLQVKTESVTVAQLELAIQLGIQLPPEIPALVASTYFRSALAVQLRIEEFGAPSFGQEEYLADLSEYLDMRVPSPNTRDEASAWIEVLSNRRTIEALSSLKLARGDFVREVSSEETEVEQVASIGDDGRVNFVGGGGRRSSPHRLVLVARAESSAATELSQVVRNRVVARNAVVPTRRQLEAELGGSRANAIAGETEANLLEGALDNARDERPLQLLLTKHPSILSTLTRGPSGRYVVPLPRLGDMYVPDFAIAAVDSTGIHWTLVELESPRAEPSTKKGLPSQALRTALDQVNSWRYWLRDNLGYARRPRSESGLGLLGIVPEAPGLILIGLGRERIIRFNLERQRLDHEQNIVVHTYSWLVGILRRPYQPLYSPLQDDYPP